MKRLFSLQSLIIVLSVVVTVGCGGLFDPTPTPEPTAIVWPDVIRLSTPNPCEIESGGKLNVAFQSDVNLTDDNTIEWSVSEGAIDGERMFAVVTAPEVSEDTSINIFAVLSTESGVATADATCSVHGIASDTAQADVDVSDVDNDEATEPPPTEDAPETPEPTPTDATDEGIELGIMALLGHGVLQVGIHENFAPFSFDDEDGTRVGFDVAIAREFARRWLGDENALTFAFVGGEQRWETLERREHHFNIAGITATAERCNRVGCSVNYFEDGARLLVDPESGIMSICDLDGQFVSALAGTTAAVNIVTELPRWCDYTVKPGATEYTERQDAIDAVKTGVVAAYTTDGLALERFALLNPPLVVVGDPFSSEPYSIMVAKENEELLTLVDATLQAMKLDGTYDALFREWFGCEKPPFPILLNDAGADSELIQGLAQTDTPLTSEPCPPPPEEYTVELGDTMIGLSVNFYGTTDLYECIHEKNREVIGDDLRLLQAGSRLLIPSLEECEQQ